MSATTVITNAGVQMPRLIYGTAWKHEATSQLVIQAVLHGFRGIDTACQPKHYRWDIGFVFCRWRKRCSSFREDLVGQALVELQSRYQIPRQHLFIQTKFTSLNGQDLSKPLPYDPRAPLAEQVRQSFARSLQNLRTEYIDSLVLHSPLPTHELTMEVYREFERFVDEGRVRQLGISNLYNVHALQRLYNDARHKPSVIQNRFYANTNHDHQIRQFCREKNIFYQSFWTLTGRFDRSLYFHSLLSHRESPNPRPSVASKVGSTTSWNAGPSVLSLSSRHRIDPADGNDQRPTHARESPSASLAFVGSRVDRSTGTTHSRLTQFNRREISLCDQERQMTSSVDHRRGESRCHVLHRRRWIIE